MQRWVWWMIAGLLLLTTGCSGTAAPAAARGSTVQILNVSYDPTREFYEEFNGAFARHYAAKTGQKVAVQ